jgi:Trichohyalin-plectin-homology domain
LHNSFSNTKRREKEDVDETPKIAWPELKSQREKTPDIETQLEAEHYLARAKLMQLEQEDEVKTAKKIILAAKCQAIRDAQMAERERLV